MSAERLDDDLGVKVVLGAGEINENVGVLWQFTAPKKVYRVRMCEPRAGACAEMVMSAPLSLPRVYQALLTRRYLTSKVMPLLAAVAVMMCCAMELIVWSVMGGFLVMLMESGRTLIGDVEISQPNTGITYYQDLIDRLQKDPMVEAATPTIETYGLLSLPYANGPRTVVVKGVDGTGFNRVTGYAAAVWWKTLERPLPKDTEAKDPRVPYHGYAAEVDSSARAVLGTPEADLVSGLHASAADVQSLLNAARQFLRIGDFHRDLSKEWIEQLKQAGGLLATAADRVIVNAPKPAQVVKEDDPSKPPKKRLPTPLDLVQNLAEAAGGFSLAEDSYQTLKQLEPQGASLSDGHAAAMVIGTEVGGYNERTAAGYLAPLYFLPGKKGTLTVVPMDRQGNLLVTELKPSRLPIVNQVRSGIFEIDEKAVIIRLDALQHLLMMDEAEHVAPGSGRGGVVVEANGRESFEQPRVTSRQPARVTNVLVRARPNVKAEALQARAREIYAQFARAHEQDVSPPPPADSRSLGIETWKDRNHTLIDAVENETGLVLFIFGVISLTSVFLVLAIFWAMVSEKTRDIGVLRAIGASRGGVAWLWVRYGLSIGIIGAVLGGIAAYLIVWNINPIHEWLGRVLHIVIWNPKVYYFSTIPHEVNPWRAAIVLLSGVLASVIGALIPAIKAANMDPVRALRWE